MTQARYRDRTAAGSALSAALRSRRIPGAGEDAVVLGLARGGVPIAAQISADLGLALDVLVIRKLGTPGHEELALGAISESRIWLNEDLVASAAVSPQVVETIVERELAELRRRTAVYRAGRAAVPVAGRTVILTDDGIATGATIRVAVLDVRAAGVRRLVLAVPTAPRSAATEFAGLTDEFICPHTPDPFLAVGMSYLRFAQVDDDEVRAALGVG